MAGSEAPSSGGTRGVQATNVGGMRRAGGRPKRAGPQSDKPEGPSEANPNQISILKYTNEDGTGLKMTPVTVLVLSLAFMVVVVALHILEKFRGAVTRAL